MKNPFSRRHHQAAPAAPEKPQKVNCPHLTEESNKEDKGDTGGPPGVTAAVHPRVVQIDPGDMNNEKREDGMVAQDISGTATTACEVNCADQEHGNKTVQEHHHKCDSDPASKPHLFSLCTKCANDGKVRWIGAVNPAL